MQKIAQKKKMQTLVTTFARRKYEVMILACWTTDSTWTQFPPQTTKCLLTLLINVGHFPICSTVTTQTCKCSSWEQRRGY